MIGLKIIGLTLTALRGVPMAGGFVLVVSCYGVSVEQEHVSQCCASIHLFGLGLRAKQRSFSSAQFGFCNDLKSLPKSLAH